MFSMILVGFSQPASNLEKKESSIRYGLNLSIFRTATVHASASPTLFLYGLKNTFFFGPKYHIDIASETNSALETDRYFDKFYQAIGFNMGYQFYPNIPINKIDFYFEYVMQYSFFKRGRMEKVGVMYYRVEEGRFDILEHTLGYGLKLRLTPKVYINQSVGYGWAFLFITEEDNTEVGTREGYFFKLGIGYDFQSGSTSKLKDIK